jgi:lysyl-tRNA synthetase class 2
MILYLELYASYKESELRSVGLLKQHNILHLQILVSRIESMSEEIVRDRQNQYTFDVTHTSEAVRESILNGELDEDTRVGIAGRLLAIRKQSQFTFGDLHDQHGHIQVVAEDGVTPIFEGFSGHNIGDWVGITGRPGTTRRGEPSIFIEDWRTLAETEISFPNAKTGIVDPEVVVRQRYLDLATNPESMQRFKNRSRIVSLVRRHLEDQEFMEVETPILQTIHGGAAAKPFATHHNALNMEVFLRIAPELYLKRLVVGGLTRVFEIGKDFRNEGMSIKHNPEFTMMEAYAAYWDGEQQMQLTENLVSNIAQELHQTTVISNNGREVDLTPPWPRVPMDRLVSDALDREVSIDMRREELVALCEKNNVHVESSYGPGKLLAELFEAVVEKDLWGPIFVTDYPAEISPLARDHRTRPGYTERFEGIVAGSELCNGFSELNDPKIQWQRFKDQERAGEHDEEAMLMDYDYIRALKYGLPPTAGLGIGIDRLVMLLTDSPSIRDIILFPLVKPDGYTVKY